MLQLQRLIGNQAVARLLGGSERSTPAPTITPTARRGMVQPLWDLPTFKARTDTTRAVPTVGPMGMAGPPVEVSNPRKTIAAIDLALAAVPPAAPDNAVARATALKTLLTAIDKYVSDKTLGAESGWFGIRGFSDKGNARIPPVLELKTQVLTELRGGRNVVGGVNWDLHDQTVEKTDDLANLKRLVAQRFGLDEANIGAVQAGDTFLGANVVAPTDWTVRQLKQAYRVLTKLPLTHTVANTNFAKFLHASSAGGGGSFSEASGTVKIGGTDKNRGDVTGPGTTTGLPGKNYMDWTVRHEIGHAVAVKVGAVDADGYCSTANGGSWLFYGKNEDIAAARDIFAATNSHVQQLLQNVAFAPFVNMTLASAGRCLLDPSLVNDVVDSMVLCAGRAGVATTKPQLLTDPAWGVLGNDLEAVWKGGAPHSVVGRTYVKSADYGLASFDDAAWARRVSAYQFRSPHEWFAEAYAAYYDPTEPNGAALENKDPATFVYIRDIVHNV